MPIWFNRYLDNAKVFWGREYNFLILAALIGALSGVAATVFGRMIAGCRWIFSGQSLTTLGFSTLLIAFILPFMPALGGALIGLLRRAFPEALRENGIHSVIENVILRNGKIKKRSFAVCAATSSITIGSGGSAGQVGPTVQIGASIGSALGQLFRLSSKRIRILVGSGAAAGIAATFNAPMAGVLFALEVIIGEFALYTFSPIVIASVMGTVTGRFLQGEHQLTLDAPRLFLVHPGEIVFYLLLGLLCGLLGRGFVQLLFRMENYFDRQDRIPAWSKPAVGGLGVGLIGVFLPQAQGNGFPIMEQALNGELVWSVALLLVFFKPIATALTLGSGGIGGTTAPSLFIGTMAGATLGMAVHGLFPEWTAGSETYAFIGMGGVVSAVLQSPLTSILLLFELTSDYTLILPIMGCCIVSAYTFKHKQKHSLPLQILLNRGLDLRRGRAVSILSSIYVRDVMEREFTTLPEDMPCEEIIKIVSTTRNFNYPVVDRENRLVGILGFSDLREAVLKSELKSGITAGELATANVVALTPNYNLNEVMEKFSNLAADELPVVQVGDSRIVIGILHRADVMAVYNRELVIQQMESA